jgi:hypothetical protein
LSASFTDSAPISGPAERKNSLRAEVVENQQQQRFEPKANDSGVYHCRSLENLCVYIAVAHLTGKTLVRPRSRPQSAILKPDVPASRRSLRPTSSASLEGNRGARKYLHGIDGRRMEYGDPSPGSFHCVVPIPSVGSPRLATYPIVSKSITHQYTDGFDFMRHVDQIMKLNLNQNC